MAEEFFLDDEELKRELESVRRRLKSVGRNIRLVEETSDRMGGSDMSLLFRLETMREDRQRLETRLKDLEARLQGWSHSRELQVKTELGFSYIPTGVLHLYEPATMPLVRFYVTNQAAKTHQLVITSKIEELSYSSTDTVEVEAGETKLVQQLPQLKLEKVKHLTEIRKGVPHTTITYLENGQKRLLQEQNFDIFLTARNVVQWAIPVGDEAGYKPLLHHVAAWVTPRAEAVKQLLRKAASRTPAQALLGYQGPPNAETVRVQAKAIFDALKFDEKITYINSPFAIGAMGGLNIQAIRLPRESLTERAANCVDGAVLYASLLEAAALEPVILLQTGHAFVGWKVWKNADDCEFLETTMTHSHSFEEAWQEGNAKYQHAFEANWLDQPIFHEQGFARLLDIKSYHDAGIYPME